MSWIELEILEGGHALPDYQGDYVVAPTFSDQVLPTKDRSLHDNVTVEAVGIVEVPNATGTTVIIAS